MAGGAAQEGIRRLWKSYPEDQDKIYGLALRMLYNPSDAEDAAKNPD